MTIVPVIQQHIEFVQSERGPVPKVKGTDIRVVDVVFWHQHLRMSAYEIVHDHAPLSLADVYAALAYYWDNRDELELEVGRDPGYAEKLRERFGDYAVTLMKQRQATSTSEAQMEHGQDESSTA